MDVAQSHALFQFDWNHLAQVGLGRTKLWQPLPERKDVREMAQLMSSERLGPQGPLPLRQHAPQRAEQGPAHVRPSWPHPETEHAWGSPRQGEFAHSRGTHKCAAHGGTCSSHMFHDMFSGRTRSRSARLRSCVSGYLQAQVEHGWICQTIYLDPSPWSSYGPYHCTVLGVLACHRDQATLVLHLAWEGAVTHVGLRGSGTPPRRSHQPCAIGRTWANCAWKAKGRVLQQATVRPTGNAYHNLASLTSLERCHDAATHAAAAARCWCQL